VKSSIDYLDQSAVNHLDHSHSWLTQISDTGVQREAAMRVLSAPSKSSSHHSCGGGDFLAISRSALVGGVIFSASRLSAMSRRAPIGSGGTTGTKLIMVGVHAVLFIVQGMYCSEIVMT
jgi:hypothetical protein